MSAFIAARPQARIALIGAPFDSTVSFRPGSRFAPNALREASYGLETFSFKQARDLEDADFCDQGDLELPFGDPKPALELIWTAAAQAFAQGQTPLLLGGEHLVSLGAVRAASAYYPELKIVHLDAHADLRDDYLGQQLSHATVMRRCLDLIGPDNLRQMGIRSGTRAEFDLNRRYRAELDEVLAWAGETPVYLSLDLDVLDPAVLPGTGTPEPGGWSFNQLINTLLVLIEHLNVVAADVVELSPMLDSSGVSSIVAAKVVREIILALDARLS